MPGQTFVIIFAILAVLLLGAFCALFMVSRRSQRTMESLLALMTKPERAKVADACRVLQVILADEIAKIEQNFKIMQDTMNAQINDTNALKNVLTEQNDKLIETANEATKKLVTMSARLENTLSGLQNVVNSGGWVDVATATEKFNSTLGGLLAHIEEVAKNTTESANTVQEQMQNWMETGQKLSEQLDAEYNNNQEQMKTLAGQSDEMQQKLESLSQTVAGGFDNVKNSAGEYKQMMTDNNNLLDVQLSKIAEFSKQSKKHLTSQLNALTNTANVAGGQVRLAEASLEQQINKLTQAVQNLISSATTTQTAVSGVSMELATLTNRFNSEIKEFATSVVSELKTVSGVANTTLENTKDAAGAFSESVKAMAVGVRETLIEMNTAHTQLTGQSESLIKMSAETTAQLQPLSELIERYYAALPDLSSGSQQASETLGQIVSSLDDKIGQMNSTVAESTTAIAESANQLENLAGQSRQQMIDLMSDYAKAVETMQTLNKQMMVARATAPMDAIRETSVNNSFATISSKDFMVTAERMFEKMHEQSMDLTRAIGAEIPDIVWTKYHAGDKTIFSKWLVKMLKASDKKHIRELLKSDSVFRSQATQFVRGFDKVVSGAKATDNSDAVVAKILKTDLGQIYTLLKANV